MMRSIRHTCILLYDTTISMILICIHCAYVLYPKVRMLGSSAPQILSSAPVNLPCLHLRYILPSGQIYYKMTSAAEHTSLAIYYTPKL